MRKSLKVLAAVAVAGLLLPAPKAHAVSKEIIQLQVQVQALQNAVQHLQQTDAEQMGAIQNIVQQTSNTVIQMNQTISALQNQLQAQQQSGGGAIQQVSTQIQSLNDSVDEPPDGPGRVATAECAAARGGAGQWRKPGWSGGRTGTGCTGYR